MSESHGVSRTSREMIERLVAFDTTSRNSNLELIEDVAGYLQGLGIESELVKSEDGRKANLYATIGPADKPGIALSGHTDVVPIDGQDWSVDPWRVSEADGRLYGRGTSDMKSFIAVALAFAPRFVEADLSTPIHFCFSYDEEVGCLGVRRLLAELSERPIKPACVIIGEPTDMKVVNAHKGKLSYRCKVRGLAGHSSLAPHCVNAVEYAARVIVRLSDMAREKAEDGPLDEDFDVPFTTVHTGPITGGTALNIVPSECSFEFEFRNLPQEDAEGLLAQIQDYAASELEPEMQAIDRQAGFEWEEMSVFPALDTPPDEEVVGLAKQLAGANSTTKVAFGTEAGLFSAGGITAVVCGPGSIEQAHKPDEYVELKQIAACEAFMERLLERAGA
ncbi:MAG: acetylornithine deacetylase [Rhodovibrionaceae bacterium]|nr:acetylornithine deacetylase [Rhodovibrionaceae bacterium]